MSHKEQEFTLSSGVITLAALHRKNVGGKSRCRGGNVG